MVILKKFINTFLYPTWLYTLFVGELTYQELSDYDNKKSLWRKFIFFYPTIIDAKSWMDGGIGEYRDPSSFVLLRKGMDHFFIDYFSKVVGLDDSILDLGCNSGRHLNALYKLGYKELSGVDVMKSALENFQLTFPKTFSVSNLKVDFFQRFLGNAEVDAFDCIYTIGATIELVHPSYDIVKAMCEVARKNVIILIQPDRHSYPRFYEYEFKRNGFKLICKIKLSESHYIFHFAKNKTLK